MRKLDEAAARETEGKTTKPSTEKPEWWKKLDEEAERIFIIGQPPKPRFHHEFTDEQK
jgi:hypothetical protein